MATIVLSAAGMALGGSVGGTVLGLGMGAIGRAAGVPLAAIDVKTVLEISQFAVRLPEVAQG